MSTHRTLPAHSVSTLAWDSDVLLVMESGAFDLEYARFAVADENAVHVVELSS